MKPVRSLCIVTFAFLGLISLVNLAPGQTWSGLGGDNNWSTASNWVGGIAPVSSNTAVITFDNPANRPNPVQNIGSPFTLTRLNINSTAGAFSLSGQAVEFDHQFGNVGNGVIIWEGNNPITVSNDWICTVNTFATTVGGSGNFVLTHTGDIRGPGEFTITAGRRLISNGTMTGTGKITVGGSGAELTINGSVASSVPTIQVGENGNFSQNAGWLLGTGVINSNVTTADASAQSNRIGSSGTLTVNGEIQLNVGSNNQLFHSAGNLAANGVIRVGNTGGIFGVTSGATLSGSGGIVANNSGRVVINGSSLATQTVAISQSSVLSGSGSVDGTVTMSGGTVTGDLILNGAVNVLGSLSQTSFFGQNTGPFNSQSNLVVNNDVRFLGTLGANRQIAGNISGSGRLIVESGFAVGMGAQTVSGVTTLVQGSLAFIGPPTTFASDGVIRIEGGTLTTNNAWTVNAPVFATGAATISDVQVGTTFNGVTTVESGTLTVGGIMQGTGSMTILDGANQTNLNGSSRMRLTLNAFGNVVGTAGSRYENTVNLLGANASGSLIMDAAVNVLSDETSILVSGATMTVAGLTSVNDGVLQVAAAATLAGTGALNVNSGGVLDVQGLVNKNTTVAELGRLQGTGELQGITDIEGFLDPGNSAGTIKVRGSVDLKSTSTVTIEIGGSTAGSGFDEIRGLGSNSTANLGGGTLALKLINGFMPNQGDQFSFLNGFSSITGTFGNGGNGGNGDGGESFDRIFFDQGSFAIEYLPTALRLSDFQAIPETGSAALLLGLACTALNRRRRLVP